MWHQLFGLHNLVINELFLYTRYFFKGNFWDQEKRFAISETVLYPGSSQSNSCCNTRIQKIRIILVLQTYFIQLNKMYWKCFAYFKCQFFFFFFEYVQQRYLRFFNPCIGQPWFFANEEGILEWGCIFQTNTAHSTKIVYHILLLRILPHYPKTKTLLCFMIQMLQAKALRFYPKLFFVWVLRVLICIY
eukprot:TRINITY_DN4482_c0_g1_i1.p3 TRINITY_DN4482_c0_g1~~TRINITY_DN4482_c0_g1_i1.p3  ORF type:complete len:189 (-),score=-15.28 TRINITY_DN4482_c0_g1_i1:280-846(-)